MTPQPRPWSTRDSLAACALCAITLLGWANSFQSGMVLDNSVLLLRDSRIRSATLDNLGLIISHTYWWPYAETGLYRPATTLSYLFNCAVLGNADNPAGYHWVNLLLHAGNVLLVFALARRLAGDLRLSFLIAAVWALHPVLTETVTNIVGRADLLAGMTTLSGLLMYLKSTEASHWRRMAWLAGLMVVTTLGVFSKESAVAVLGVIVLYELTLADKRRLRGFIDGCLAMSPALLAMWAIRSMVLGGLPPADFPFVDNPIVGADFRTGRLTAVKVMAKDLGLLIWPSHLSVDYSYRQVPLTDGRLTDWIAWIVAAAAAVAVAFLYRRNKAAFFAAGFSFVTLLPTSNLVIPVGTIMAERFLYLPAVGFAICLILALDSAGRFRVGKPAPLVLGLAIAAAFGVRTWVRNKDWRDDLTIWAAAVRTSPLSFKTHRGLGDALMAHGDTAGGLAEAERGLAILDSLPPRSIPAVFYIQTGIHYMDNGDSLRRPDSNGNMLTPPESISSYNRAKSLLLRSAAILQAQRDADRGAGDPLFFSADSQLAVNQLLSEVDRRLNLYRR